MKVISTISFILLFSAFIYGQQNEGFKNVRCDSVSTISVEGKINYKLIYHQTSFSHTIPSVFIPQAKICPIDKSKIISQHSQSKQITTLQLGYDTCIVAKSSIQPNCPAYITFPPNQVISKLSGWKFETKSLGEDCRDTRFNFVHISKKGYGYVNFDCLSNIATFELDLNNDNKKEVYLISYAWCTSTIKIYRIDAF